MGVMRPISRLLDFAEDSDRLTGLEAIFQIRATKPDAFERAGALTKRHLEDRHRSRAQQHRSAHFADDARHLAADEFMQSPGIGAIFIAEGEVIEQIFCGADLFFGERLSDARADSFDELDGRIGHEHALMLEHFR
jgi:hypothetical protein